MDQNQIDKLKVQYKNASTWFYYIGALTIINIVLYVVGSDLGFLVGLTFPNFLAGFFAGAIGAASDATLNIILFILNALFGGIFIYLGYVATNKRNMGAYTAGFVLYCVDFVSLIFLALTAEGGDFTFSLAFHVFVVIMLAAGFSYSKKLKAAEAQMPINVDYEMQSDDNMQKAEDAENAEDADVYEADEEEQNNVKNTWDDEDKDNQLD